MTLYRLVGTRCVAIAAALSLAACGGHGSTAPAPQAGNGLQALMQQKIKHVFVIVQENHSFDNYFGTYPGTAGQTVENLGTQLAQQSENQYDPASGTTVAPFTVTDPHIYGGDQSAIGTNVKMDAGKMDDWLREQEYGPTLTPTTVSATSHANAVAMMGVYDCNTIPYLWYYAKNFTLFDHYFQADTGPSTPGNIQVFAAQIGQSEAAAGKGVSSGVNAGDGVPIANDDNPPSNIVPGLTSFTGDNATTQSYATMPVLLNPMEDAAATFTGQIPDDLKTEASSNRPSIPWGWYEEGMVNGVGYVPHHVAPLYFDYITHNQAFYQNLYDNTPSTGLLPAIKAHTLPTSGVFWVKGGSKNAFGFSPQNGDTNFLGDDDHPGSGNSDHEIAEAYVATLVNAIAQSPYWSDSVIILTWDDMGGFYDHVPPAHYESCPDDGGQPCGDGPRLPMMIISPFAKTGVVVHDYNDAASISKFIEDAFNLPTLGSLPDEKPYEPEGPRDINSMVGDLTGALDEAKLSGASAPIPAAMAEIPAPSVPPSMSCSTLGLTPSPVLASPPPSYTPL
ncbi:MAG TPA: alkaline phosphatase family protein [Candidatus Limnocylindria bacterium]|jgi:phospholipase C|nr:alkaline phosphatase family protein [Candidatus Limnocylindria bacterium]